MIAIIILLALLCICAVYANIELDADNRRLALRLSLYDTERLCKTKRTVKFINTHNCGDKTVLDKYVEALQNDGFAYYPEGCHDGILAFYKDEKIIEENLQQKSKL